MSCWDTVLGLHLFFPIRHSRHFSSLGHPLVCVVIGNCGLRLLKFWGLSPWLVQSVLPVLSLRCFAFPGTPSLVTPPEVFPGLLLVFINNTISTAYTSCPLLTSFTDSHTATDHHEKPTVYTPVIIRNQLKLTEEAFLMSVHIGTLTGLCSRLRSASSRQRVVSLFYGISL